MNQIQLNLYPIKLSSACYRHEYKLVSGTPDLVFVEKSLRKCLSLPQIIVMGNYIYSLQDLNPQNKPTSIKCADDEFPFELVILEALNSGSKIVVDVKERTQLIGRIMRRALKFLGLYRTCDDGHYDPNGQFIKISNHQEQNCQNLAIWPGFSWGI